MENLANVMVVTVSAIAALMVFLATWLDPISPPPQEEESRPIIVACDENIEGLLEAGHVVIQEGCDEPAQNPQPTVIATAEASE
jgi:hypothetical protein